MDPDSRTASYYHAPWVQDDVSFYPHHSTPKHLDPDSRTASYYHALWVQGDAALA